MLKSIYIQSNKCLLDNVNVAPTFVVSVLQVRDIVNYENTVLFIKPKLNRTDENMLSTLIHSNNKTVNFLRMPCMGSCLKNKN